MQFLLNTLSFLSVWTLLISVVIAGLWYSATKKGRTTIISDKVGKISALVAVIALVVFFSATSASPSSKADNSSSESSSSSVATSSSKKRESSKSDEAGDDPDDLTSKELNTFNSSLADGLTEDQGYANDGNDKYNYALFIDSVSYIKGRGLHVKVLPQFKQLKKDEKKTVGNRVQGMAQTQFLIMGKEINPGDSMYTSFYDGGTRIGGSKMSNASDFKWK